MKELSYFEIKQCELIAKHTPYSFVDVKAMFLDCDRSFDLTELALATWSASNDRMMGLRVANETRKGCGRTLSYFDKVTHDHPDLLK